MATLLPSLRNNLPASAAAGRHFLQHQLPRAALYHSHSHAPPPPPFSPAASTILSSAFTHVPEHGFTDMALTLGARDAGYLDITTNLFPRGPFEIVYYHLVMSRLNLHQQVQFPSAGVNGGRELGVGQKIRTLVVERLRANEKVLGRWQEVSNVNPHIPYRAHHSGIFRGWGGAGRGVHVRVTLPTVPEVWQSPECSTLLLAPGK